MGFLESELVVRLHVLTASNTNNSDGGDDGKGSDFLSSSCAQQAWFSVSHACTMLSAQLSLDIPISNFFHTERLGHRGDSLVHRHRAGEGQGRAVAQSVTASGHML